MPTPINDGEGMIFKSEDILSDLPAAAKLWLGKDYTNFIVKDFDNLEMPYQDLVDRSTTPRMPWHDMGVMVQGATARDVARHFIQRWNSIKVCFQKNVMASCVVRYPNNAMGCEKYIAIKTVTNCILLQLEKAKLNLTYPFLLPKSYDCKTYAPFMEHIKSHNVKCQVLRSVSSWSAGFLDPDTLEQSIHEAYIQAISNAQR